MTENGVNSAVFESWSGNGTSQLVTVDEVGGDKRVVFTYGGDSVDMIITYNDAELSMDAGAGDWVTGEVAYVTVNDPDQNKFPTVTETLSVGDEDAIEAGNATRLVDQSRPLGHCDQRADIVEQVDEEKDEEDFKET